MMKISTKGRYALRLMLDLALSSNGKAVPLKECAKRQGISDKYLEQIVTQLSRAHMVRSVRGAGGGYLLTREPSEYTIGEILRTLEGDLSPVSCAPGAPCCERSDDCVTREVWQKVQEAVDQVVDGISLADLIERSHQICCSHQSPQTLEL